MFKNDFEKDVFFSILDNWNVQYNENEKMIKRPFSSPGYHTTLTGGFVHPTRDSLTYAVALLDSQVPEFRQRAFDIVERVIALQDTNPENRTYGIWSWFMDEPLEQMSPPDWNWADFCGKELLQIIIDYGNLMSEELKAKVKTAIIHACKSIIRRNVGPDYTNIAFMGTFVTHVAGEYFAEDEILTYAKNRLQRIYDDSMQHGAFREYNSPTYTMVVVEDIARMKRYIKGCESLKIIEKLNHFVWKSIAEHFHYPTRQWAGPHSRCYKTIQGEGFLYKLQKALNDKVLLVDETKIKNDCKDKGSEIDLDLFRLRPECPDEFMKYFTGFVGEHDANCEYIKPIDGNIAKYAYTYLTQEYALSAFSQATFWNQARALLCYFGDEKSAKALHLKCLHDFYDYSSGMIVSKQIKGDVASVISFATNGGDTHCNIDMVKNATIKAKDLRMRYEITGRDLEKIEILDKLDEGYVVLSTDKMKLRIDILYVKFGNCDTSCGITRNTDSILIDIILYTGEERSINFAELEQAVLGLTLQVKCIKEEFIIPKAKVENGNIEVAINEECRITGNIKPEQYP